MIPTMSMSIKDKSTLYANYMPFITNGGLFIPSQREYTMGQEVFLILNLMENNRLPIAAKVVWISNTEGSSMGRMGKGIGVQFSTQDNGTTKDTIEKILGGSIESSRDTKTM
ncbi:MAG: PilZ domain-containing protein [Gammaproteobacteria bacterium]|nr:PilZ domain-containing protein [Pseudomonadota bacterium]MCH9663701.1 PilZ domain-containing protein [Gammaproteobacteria bacterium]